MPSEKNISKAGTQSTRLKLALAAETLFALRGVDAVSFREIAAAANNGNNNAVQYHFGSREGLVEAIFSYRISQMEPTRRKMMKRAQQNGRLGDPRTLIEIMCLPYLQLINDNGRYTYSGFCAQYLTRSRPTDILHAPDLEIVRTPSLRELIVHLEHQISYIPAELRTNRIMIAGLMFHNTIVRWDCTDVLQKAQHPLRDLVLDVLETCTAALIAPYRPSSDQALYDSALIDDAGQIPDSL